MRGGEAPIMRGAEDTSGRRRPRKPQERPRVPIGPIEAIRARLGMNLENFSEALGFHPTTYAGYLNKGFITKTAALAAEALIRRQHSEGESGDEVYIVRVINGTPTAMRITDLGRLKLNNQDYYLVPVNEAQL